MKNYFYKGKEIKVGDSIMMNDKSVILTKDFLEANKNIFEAVFYRCVDPDSQHFKYNEIYAVNGNILIDATVCDDIGGEFNSADSKFIIATYEDFFLRKMYNKARLEYKVGTYFVATSQYKYKEREITLKTNEKIFWNSVNTVLTASEFPGDIYNKERNDWAVIVHPYTSAYVKIKTDVKQNTNRWAAREPGRIYKVNRFFYDGEDSCIVYHVSDEKTPPSAKIYIQHEDCEESNLNSYFVQNLCDITLKKYKEGDVVREAGTKKVSVIYDMKFAWTPNKFSLWVKGKEENVKLYSQHHGWAEILHPVKKTSDDVDVYHGMKYYFVVNERIENKSYKDEMSIYPVFADREKANKWIEKNIVKDLKYYENKLLHDDREVNEDFTANVWEMYNWMKKNEPRLYWKKILELIVNDLNYDNSLFNSLSHQKMILIELDRTPDSHYHTIEYYGQYKLGMVCFKSVNDAQHVINLMGSNLKYCC